MPDNHHLVRQYLINELNKDLVGPDKPDEELLESPVSRYLTGVLFPQNQKIDPEEDSDSADAADTDDSIDMGTLLATTTNPSAIGLTFNVKKKSKINITSEAAVYQVTQNGRRKIWKRKQLETKPLQLHLDKAESNSETLAPGLKIFWRIRERVDRMVVTITMLNQNKVTSDERPDTFCFFQPSIRIDSNNQVESIFLPNNNGNTSSNDPDRALNNLLYHHVPEYAVGHGCATEWDTTRETGPNVITTKIIPSFEFLQFSADPVEPFKAQEMKFLAEAEKAPLIRELRILVDRYRHWINSLDPQIISAHSETAKRNIEECRLAANRMERGIELIATDDLVRKAFQFANKAMLMQRARIVWMRHSENKSLVPVEDDSHRWRPFQLGFILLTLSSIAVPSDEARSIVDLLWFPTGGGKTESYLGLAAFTIFLRRLKGKSSKKSAGVTALMRYTLRLLTIQQFQRAATLIMACELIRRRMPEELGIQEISLGLWVGGGATPNSLIQAEEALNELLEGERVLESNPYQIQNCPWCGTKLSPHNYHINVVMSIQCPNEDCQFSSHLPLYLVDDDIYNRQPTLLIGTVDKFARLPWLADTAKIFGGIEQKHLPPELIIQDELHLISGPLGTMVGLYETAIDLLCQQGHIPPKIIASTATIRRAAEQSLGLFNRDFSQFPPPGLDARDNFFAIQVSASQKPGRCYVGVHAPGRSMKTSLLRIYAILLQKISELEVGSNLHDPYWTLVGYFNSLRELGGAVRLVEDDVRDRIQLLARRGGEKQRFLSRYRELNSRIGSDEIPELLDQMSLPKDNPNCLDVLLATNMISVGVDVDRLGLMVVTGQPKMTSEYIQATSRVGRQFPGLVITLYNWSRSRDRSHYERFTSYHSSIYSQVEPTSVTPFSSRARDRGLHGVFIALIRHLIPLMHSDFAAGKFDPDAPEVQDIIERIVTRVESVDKEEAENTRKELSEICHLWSLRAAEAEELSYSPSYKNKSIPYLMDIAENRHLMDDSIFPTLNSMRDVEGESGIFFK